MLNIKYTFLHPLDVCSYSKLLCDLANLGATFPVPTTCHGQFSFNLMTILRFKLDTRQTGW